VDRPDVEKVMILLTDGLNTANRFTTNPSQIDSRTAAVCENIKNAKIKLFTVRGIEGNLSLLQGCASASNLFATCRSQASSRASSRRSPPRSPARGYRGSRAMRIAQTRVVNRTSLRRVKKAANAATDHQRLGGKLRKS
jgi:hypothetical protein